MLCSNYELFLLVVSGMKQSVFPETPDFGEGIDVM